MAERPTFFVDRSLGKRVGRILREAGAMVELLEDHFAQDEADVSWIPSVAIRGWVILTKDKNIRRNCGELDELLRANAKVFTLSSGNLSVLNMANRFLHHLVEIERISMQHAGPFAYTVNETELLPIINPPAASSPTPPPATDDT